ncbi:protoporphyrinogen oxidase [Sporolactobacillus sp. THM7-4]|nr:protoporphyrinogen oxidase [Sporolactobacillus sp. THM7-4]
MPGIKTIAVVGGGITGLSAAFYIRKTARERGLPVDLQLFEASGRLGGNIDTVRENGFVIERGPDSFLKRKPEALDLVRDLGLQDQLVENRTGQSYILKDGRLHLIPGGSVMGIPGELKPFLASDLLSLDGKARVLEELFTGRPDSFDDMSVGAFFERRFGREMVDSIIAPLLSGVYGGDLYRLSLASTLPQFKKIAEHSDSLLKAIHHRAPKKKTSQFATLKTGLSGLVDKLAEKLEGTYRLNAGVKAVRRNQDGSYRLFFQKGEAVSVDAVIFTVPLETVKSFFPEVEGWNRDNAAPDTSMATVAMAFDKSAVDMDQDGTGFVVSANEPISITAATWTHLKWPHTVPEGKALLRTFVGKPGHDELLDENDRTLVDLSLRDLNAIKGLTILHDPEFSIVTRLKKSMPQYEVGHRSWLNRLYEQMRRLHPFVRLAGMPYDGVGLPDCIRQGRQAAGEIIRACCGEN